MERVNLEVLIQTVENDKKLSDCAKSALLTALNHLAELEDKIENGTIAKEIAPKIVYCEDSGMFEVLVPNVGYRGVCLCSTKDEAEKRLEELRG